MKSLNFIVLIGAALLTMATVASEGALADASKPFHEVERFKIGGDGGWDYLNMHEPSDRLFIARGDRISVVDLKTGKLTGEVSGLDGAHGTAFDDKLGLGFSTSGKSGEVVVFDLKSLAVKSKIKVGTKPDWIYFDPSSRKVFAFNGTSHDVSVIDPKALKVEATIPLPGKPETAQGDGAGHIFVNIEDLSELVKIDTKTLKIVDTYPLKPCEEPTGLSINPKDRHLFVGCGNETALTVDSSNGKILKSFKVGSGVDAAAFDSKKNLAFISAGEGNVTVIADGKDGGETLPLVATVKGARTMAVDSKSGRVFLASAEFAPPAETKPGEPKARPAPMPGTFFILVLAQ